MTEQDEEDAEQNSEQPERDGVLRWILLFLAITIIGEWILAQLVKLWAGQP
ncbi:MAG TPA: hypothetical protein VJL80_09815 [Aeromicrobium sp.]|nr:hypothetical protein [Aeromicrobium sp.]HKY58322.1 hypothetical protein [Aeromicrobium sp.]